MAIAMPSRPNGTLIRKIQRHEVQVTMAPPTRGPIMRPMAGGTVNQIMAATICAGATLRSRIQFTRPEVSPSSVADAGHAGSTSRTII